MKSILIIFSLMIELLTSCNSQKTMQTNSDANILKTLFITNLACSKVFNFPPKITFIDEYNQQISLDSLFKSEKFVLRFTYSSCENCIISELKNLQATSPEIKSKIIILVSYQSPRFLQIIKNKYKINFPIYFIDEKIANIIIPNTLNNLTQPYIFHVNSDLLCSRIYIPSVSFPDISIEYYKHSLDDTSNSHTKLFSQNIINFGEVKVNKEYEFNFEYTNHENYPLIIMDIKTTCGCTVVHWNKQPLNPGKSSKIVVKFKPDNTGYHFKKIILHITKIKRYH